MTAPDSRDSVEMRLLNDLHLIASQGETPDGDGVTVNVQLWAEKWADRLQALARGPQQAGGEDWIAVAERLPTEGEWPVGKVKTALIFHPDYGIRSETMRPEHWNHIDRRGPGYHGPKVTHWRFPTPPRDAAFNGGQNDA